MAAIWMLAPAGAHAATATFTGESILIADNSQTDRLNQTGPSSCGAPSPVMVNGGGGTRFVDTFRFRNINPSPLCVTVTLNTACTSGETLMSAAYTGIAQPADLTTGFLGHLGHPGAGQASYGFNVPANTDFVVSVAGLNTGGGCDPYDLTVHVPFAPNVLERDDGLLAGDPTQIGRLERSGISSTCAAPTTNPSLSDPTTAFRYDAFTFTNTGSAPSCVTVSSAAPTCPNGTAQSVAYLDSFNPASPLTNFLAAQNVSSFEHFVPAYSFTVPAGRTFVVVTSAAENGACSAYHLSVDGSNVVNGVPSSVPGKGVAGTKSGEGTLASVSGLAFSSKTFAAESSGPSAYSAKKKPPAGTKVSYTLNEAASVRFTITQRAKGRKAKRGKKTVCAKPTRKNRKRKRCTRVVTLKGSFSRSGVAGKNSFHFTGRLRGKKLKPGRYRLVATPTAAGKKGKPTASGFRIAR